ncbi:MAG: alpha-glucosidase [Christensenellales bacterium]
MERNWWKEMVVYQIWPRSFCDGNGDGIGDLKGVLGKLEYIRDLGATAIWFSPLYVSPQADYGYDIADYRNINPEYGTLDDFKEVLEKAHSLGLRVIMDLVVNHTSNRHEWFLKSREGGENNPYKDYYIWRKGRGKDGKKFPNNWTSTFPGDGWQYDEKRKEYYLHLFAVEQPDLNMDNPAVRQEVKDIMKYWLDMGVDGFREDVITFISKREGLPNGFPLMPAARGMEHYKNGPRIHEFLREFKTVWNSYDAMTVGEAPMMTPKTALKYISYDKQELNMMFHFQHMEADCFLYSWVHTGFNLVKLKKIYNNWQTKLYGKAWNALYIENHDQPRIISRYGSEKFRVESGKALAVMYLCQSGTPFIYQGQEIGMTNCPLEKLEDYPDVNTHACYALFKKFGLSDERLMKLARYAARDNARTCMQWNGGENAGFTTGKPWFVVNKNYKEINVEDSLNDENSILNFYKKLLSLRKENPVFLYGDFVLHYKRHKKLFVYERNYEGKKLFVAINFSETDTPVATPKGVDLGASELLIANYPVADKSEMSVLRPYEARVYLK